MPIVRTPAFALVVTLIGAVAATGTDGPPDHGREFDFWLGAWDVQNRHLQDDGTWRDTFRARATIASVVDGHAVLEAWSGIDGHPLRGFSLRAWDPDLERWVVILNWTARGPSGFGRMEGTAATDHISIFPPGVADSGTKRYERYTFSEAAPTSCRWDAARTADGGETWQTYWIMAFTRTAAPSSLDASTVPIVPVPESPYCTGPSRQLDVLVGDWRGTITRGDRAGVVRLRGTTMLEGCGLQLFTDITWSDDIVERRFEALAFDPRKSAWMRCAVDASRVIRVHETALDLEQGTWTVPGVGTWTIGDTDTLHLEGEDATMVLERVR